MNTINLFSQLWSGLKMTLFVFIVTLIVSFSLAVLLSLVYQKAKGVIKRCLSIYITLERGTPLLLQMMFIYYGLPYLNLNFNRLTTVLIAFILNYTAYFIEINRAGLEAISPKQYEAALVLGYKKWQIYYHIIGPQAFKVALPAITNETLTLIKDTSLITVLGVSEILKVTKTAVNTYATAIPFIYAGLIYLMLTITIEYGFKLLERRYYDFNR